MMTDHRSWFAVDGSLEPIDFDGESFFRFPEAVAEFAIERYSRPGDWVLDPFAWFGTRLVVAERLGRHGFGCEVDERRARFAAAWVAEGRVLNVSAGELGSLGFPLFDLFFTSPPYGSFRLGEVDDEPKLYLVDAGRLFLGSWVFTGKVKSRVRPASCRWTVRMTAASWSRFCECRQCRARELVLDRRR